MPKLEDNALFRELKAGAIAPVYLLYGAESSFVRSALTQIQSQAVQPGFESFNLQHFDGEKALWTEIEDACEALPMLSPRKCVCVKDADADKLPKADLERLMSLTANPSDTTVLVLYMISVQVDPKKAKWKKLIDAAAKSGVACEFAFKDWNTLRRALCERARKAHVALDMDTAGVLVDRCSQSYSILQNELDKLIAYVSGGGSYTITEEDVDECCIRSIDSSAFDLAKSILAGNFDKAYRLLDELFYLRQEAISILGALAMAFGDLYRARCALSAGKSADQVAEDFRYPKNRLFAVRNAFRDVRSFSGEQLRSCMAALYEADRQLKSSKLGDRLILEEMLGRMRCTSARRQGAGAWNG